MYFSHRYMQICLAIAIENDKLKVAQLLCKWHMYVHTLANRKQCTNTLSKKMWAGERNERCGAHGGRTIVCYQMKLIAFSLKCQLTFYSSANVNAKGQMCRSPLTRSGDAIHSRIWRNLIHIWVMHFISFWPLLYPICCDVALYHLEPNWLALHRAHLIVRAQMNVSTFHSCSLYFPSFILQMTFRSK